MKMLGILHDFRIFFVGKISFYWTLRKARKIPGHLHIIINYGFYQWRSSGKLQIWGHILNKWHLLIMQEFWSTRYWLFILKTYKFEDMPGVFWIMTFLLIIQEFWCTSYWLFIQSCYRFPLSIRARIHLCSQTTNAHTIWWNK